MVSALAPPLFIEIPLAQVRMVSALAPSLFIEIPLAQGADS